MKPGAVDSSLRTAPPGSGSASSTSTSQPRSARSLAATRPFGPAPITTASTVTCASRSDSGSDLPDAVSFLYLHLDGLRRYQGRDPSWDGDREGKPFRA